MTVTIPVWLVWLSVVWLVIGLVLWLPMEYGAYRTSLFYVNDEPFWSNFWPRAKQAKFRVLLPIVLWPAALVEEVRLYLEYRQRKGRQ